MCINGRWNGRCCYCCHQLEPHMFMWFCQHNFPPKNGSIDQVECVHPEIIWNIEFQSELWIVFQYFTMRLINSFNCAFDLIGWYSMLLLKNEEYLSSALQVLVRLKKLWKWTKKQLKPHFIEKYCLLFCWNWHSWSRLGADQRLWASVGVCVCVLKCHRMSDPISFQLAMDFNFRSKFYYLN